MFYVENNLGTGVLNPVQVMLMEHTQILSSRFLSLVVCSSLNAKHKTMIK